MRPKCWNDAWQAALFEAKKETPFLKAGIKAEEFGQFVGIGAGSVNVQAAKGQEHFRRHFAEHCDFWELEKAKAGQCIPYLRRFTFYGVLHPSQLYRYSLWLLPLKDFARQEAVSIKEVQRYVRMGHQAFRDRFKVWEFFTRRSHPSTPLEYWFGRVEDLGAREDEDAIPGDFLTTNQFARLQGLSKAAVTESTVYGRKVFQERFPGWSFVGLAGRNFRFMRLGKAIEVLTVHDFTKHAQTLTTQQVKHMLEQGCFSEKFPGYYGKPVDGKRVSWVVYRAPEAKLWEPPVGSISITQLANLVSTSYTKIEDLIKISSFKEVFPGWKAVQHPTTRRWFLYPATADAPNPPRTAIELYGLLSLQEAGAAFGFSAGWVNDWIRDLRLMRARAPGWTVVRLTFKGKSVWLKPPQCLLAERPER